MATNLIEGLHKQMDRARELRKVYEGIPTGGFATGVIDRRIKHAERSIENGDVVEMLSAYNGLEALE